MAPRKSWPRTSHVITCVPPITATAGSCIFHPQLEAPLVTCLSLSQIQRNQWDRGDRWCHRYDPLAGLGHPVAQGGL